MKRSSLSWYKQKALWLVLLALFLSCTKNNSFAPKPKVEGYSNSAFGIYRTTNCASHDVKRENLYVLFLYDISSSVIYNPQLIQSFLDAAGVGSQNYDTRIMFAPIQGTTLTGFPVMGTNTVGLGSAVNLVGTPPALASLVRGGSEDGLKRAYDIVMANSVGSNKVFENTTTDYDRLMIIVASTGDNQDHIVRDYNNNVLTGPTSANLASRINNIKSLSALMPGALAMDDVILVSFNPHSNCKTGLTPGMGAYQAAARDVYNFMSHTYDAGSASPSAYDICEIASDKFYYVAERTANPQTIPFSYQKAGISPVLDFNPSEVRIWKSTSSSVAELTPGTDFNVSSTPVTAASICTSPNSAFPCTETYTGYVANLLGFGVYTHPECIIVQKQSPDIFVGYAVMSTKPLVPTIEVKKNGTIIPQSATNGWTVYGNLNYQANMNVRVISATSSMPTTPAITKSGFMVQLHGSATVTNDDFVEVRYVPCPPSASSCF